MINAHKEQLQSFFQNNIQYEIPFFQRSYVWEEESWQTLWDHIEYEVDEYKEGLDSEHFIGTVITKQKQSQALGENKVELVDGQQRLTTITILLKAIEATGTGELKNLKTSIQSLLKFQNSRGEDFHRIEHSRNDAPYYKAILDDEDLDKLSNQKNNILMAYRFYLGKLKDLTDDDRDIFRNVLLQKVPVISMLLSPNDDEQEIFDTINSLGVRLTTGELLKNYIFKNKTIQPLYETTWQAVFEKDDETVEFWNRSKTAGRVKRTNIEVLLYCYLIIKTGDEVRMDRLFKEYKKYFATKTEAQQIEFLDDLKTYALIYGSFPAGELIYELTYADHERRFFRVIDGIEVSTAYPLIMYLYQTVADTADRLKCLHYLEGYLVRRNICKLTTKNYNKLFVQIMNELKAKPGFSSDDLKSILLEFEENTNRYPTDEEVKEAAKKVTPSNKNAREILFIIALKNVDHAYADTKKLNVYNFSVEHMMPKQWEENWPEPTFTDIEKNTRWYALRTLGNLTLITRNLNSKLKNDSWNDKRATLREFSSLNMTTDYLDNDQWNETLINQRANTLLATALEIWKLN